ncbi:MAG: tRNA (adenosine(37)-N6)-threonylcarbamoyltransferase complex dimerization subunit type 1 TsaB [Gemmatimonadales bacterium]
MWLAIDTSSDEVSVALGEPATVLAEEHALGKRRHARELLPMIGRVMAVAGTELAALRGVLVTDGPGSFTGLRIGASVAKALAHTLHLELWRAPSLLVQAAGSVADCPERILAVADALRGEVYAAMYRFPAGRVEVEVRPGIFRPADLLREVPRPKVVVGRLKPEIMRVFDGWTADRSVVLVDSGPRAGVLLELLGRAGALDRVPEASVGRWEPDYGRPAEAQAIWERKHGRPLRHQNGTD